ncbi:hypothetical protein DPM19_00785 [Actinomadura craniellae]|uniref:Uncharacterized protein n=1 Tax=Actinomadura craniellae TaxID=2231787 RepID=A0A365HC85_9ACTN|nr:hypothetical protein [Actinomadura craniellae]RAY16740.1 hypothetical protein DPM19_00785 [Actinomadura craniellae]
MLKINDDRMTATFDGTEIATATRTGAVWVVSTWPYPLTYNAAITALTLAERLASGHGDDDPFVITWREELAHG